MFRWIAQYVRKVEVFGVGVELRAPTESSAAPPQEASAGAPAILTLSPEAAQFVHWHCGQHNVVGDWRLRVGVTKASNDVPRHTVEIDLGPISADDVEFVTQGVRVVVARSELDQLRGSRVGYATTSGGTGFYVEHPQHRPQ